MIGSKMKVLRLEKHLTLEELADALNKKYPNTVNFNKGKLSKWENDREEPKLSSIRILADFYNIKIDDFYVNDIVNTSIETIYNKLEPPRQAKVYSFAEAQLKEQDNPKVKNLSEYKEEKQEHEILLQSKVSAGRGVIDLDPSATETITYYGKLPRHFDMAFKVDGNSMEPVFENGDIIFVEKMEEVINGALMVVTVNDEAYIKKVYLDDDCIRLVSLNKEYKDIHATEGINIVGKVVF